MIFQNLWKPQSFLRKKNSISDIDIGCVEVGFNEKEEIWVKKERIYYVETSLKNVVCQEISKDYLCFLVKDDIWKFVEDSSLFQLGSALLAYQSFTNNQVTWLQLSADTQKKKPPCPDFKKAVISISSLALPTSHPWNIRAAETVNLLACSRLVLSLGDQSFCRGIDEGLVDLPEIEFNNSITRVMVVPPHKACGGDGRMKLGMPADHYIIIVVEIHHLLDIEGKIIYNITNPPIQKISKTDEYHKKNRIPQMIPVNVKRKTVAPTCVVSDIPVRTPLGGSTAPSSIGRLNVTMGGPGGGPHERRNSGIVESVQNENIFHMRRNSGISENGSMKPPNRRPGLSITALPYEESSNQRSIEESKNQRSIGDVKNLVIDTGINDNASTWIVPNKTCAVTPKGPNCYPASPTLPNLISIIDSTSPGEGLSEKGGPSGGGPPGGGSSLNFPEDISSNDASDTDPRGVGSTPRGQYLNGSPGSSVSLSAAELTSQVSDKPIDPLRNERTPSEIIDILNETSITHKTADSFSSQYEMQSRIERLEQLLQNKEEDWKRREKEMHEEFKTKFDLERDRVVTNLIKKFENSKIENLQEGPNETVKSRINK
eukprot:GHVL01002472.1.p1 GENE.GHVL01002472.1~~GHVL01002472.1.p1  ORF type:complete len:600 (+),score=170.51 GHVL01002472.1:20-1819(+)